jgi:hypothetical protein
MEYNIKKILFEDIYINEKLRDIIYKDCIEIVSEYLYNEDFTYKHSESVSKIFEGIEVPNITLAKYLERYYIYLFKSDIENFILFCYISIYYIEKIKKYNKFEINCYNIHRVIGITLSMAYKFLIDEPLNNVYLADVMGLPINEFNDLELNFLYYINFSLHIEINNFIQFIDKF